MLRAIAMRLADMTPYKPVACAQGRDHVQDLNVAYTAGSRGTNHTSAVDARALLTWGVVWATRTRPQLSITHPHRELHVKGQCW